uniref:Mini-chromosome maintenance complex-binding protein n=1 Tax=Trichobilharzia regenti TaxID=157069 RepID=A0AA85K9L9_TRIRE|nr:unnamed protein product [Trichobilharzia regenti]
MEVGDLIATPLKIYDQICHANADKSFHDEVQKVVNDYSSKVPLYGCTTLDRIPDGHLVRIIGMVQDMFNSELYMDTYRLSANDETIRSFRYRDYSDFQL